MTSLLARPEREKEREREIDTHRPEDGGDRPSWPQSSHFPHPRVKDLRTRKGRLGFCLLFLLAPTTLSHGSSWDDDSREKKEEERKSVGRSVSPHNSLVLSLFGQDQMSLNLLVLCQDQATAIQGRQRPPFIERCWLGEQKIPLCFLSKQIVFNAWLSITLAQ